MVAVNSYPPGLSVQLGGSASNMLIVEKIIVKRIFLFIFDFSPYKL